MTFQPPYRIGNGFDVHRLVAGRKLILGGIEIPFERGLEGHSDADALLHAVCDAILGALAAGDIGQHFPNTDPRWKDCDSAVFVQESVRLARQAGYRVSNLDVTIHAERPKLRFHIDTMRKRVSELVDAPESCIGIKAGTMEKMGFVGREEGIAVSASVLLQVASGG